MIPAQVRTSASRSPRSSSSLGGQYAIGRASQRLHGKAELAPEDPNLRVRAEARGLAIEPPGPSQDFRDVLEKNVPTSGRMSRLPHWGHFPSPFSHSLIDRVSDTSFCHLSQKNW